MNRPVSQSDRIELIKKGLVGNNLERYRTDTYFNFVINFLAHTLVEMMDTGTARAKLITEIIDRSFDKPPI